MRTKDIPISWDPALEVLLNSNDIKKQKRIEWSDKTIQNYSETKDFMEVINKKVPVGTLKKRTLGNENSYVKEREAKIRRMIERPPSPRKELYLPSLSHAVQQHDKMKTENIHKERSHASTSFFQTPFLPIDNSKITRRVTAPTKYTATFKSTPIFYWGT